MQCPKCRHIMWVSDMGESTWFKCVCGKLVPIEINVDGIRRIYHPRASEEFLPRKGSKLSLCLGTLASVLRIDTQSLAKMLNQTTSETASQLSVLQSKGLVDKENNRKGMVGGSIWILTETSAQVLKVRL